MHKRGYFHRDIKPENILLKGNRCVIADFGELCFFILEGLAREIYSNGKFTGYVSTRWYRAPEILLRAPAYGPKIDIWALGAILAELYTLRPLFPGSSEPDQLYKICELLGSPTIKSESIENNWPSGCKAAAKLNLKFPPFDVSARHRLLKRELRKYMSELAFDLLKKMLIFDPEKRISASSALAHPYFQAVQNSSQQISTPTKIQTSPIDFNPTIYRRRTNRKLKTVFNKQQLHQTPSVAFLRRRSHPKAPFANGIQSPQLFPRVHKPRIHKVDQKPARQSYRVLHSSESTQSEKSDSHADLSITGIGALQKKSKLKIRPKPRKKNTFFMKEFDMLKSSSLYSDVEKGMNGPKYQSESKKRNSKRFSWEKESSHWSVRRRRKKWNVPQ